MGRSLDVDDYGIHRTILASTPPSEFLAAKTEDPAGIIRRTKLVPVDNGHIDIHKLGLHLIKSKAVLFVNEYIAWVIMTDPEERHEVPVLFIDVSYKFPPRGPPFTHPVRKWGLGKIERTGNNTLYTAARPPGVIVSNHHIETSPGSGFVVVPHDDNLFETDAYTATKRTLFRDKSEADRFKRGVTRWEPAATAYRHRRFWVRPSYDPERRRWDVAVRVLQRNPEPCHALASIDQAALQASVPPYRADGPTCRERRDRAPLLSVEDQWYPHPSLSGRVASVDGVRTHTLSLSSPPEGTLPPGLRTFVGPSDERLRELPPGCLPKGAVIGGGRGNPVTRHQKGESLGRQPGCRASHNEVKKDGARERLGNARQLRPVARGVAVPAADHIDHRVAAAANRTGLPPHAPLSAAATQRAAEWPRRDQRR